MIATKYTKITTTFDGKQKNYRMYISQLKGTFMVKVIQGTLAENFKEDLPASEKASCQNAKQKEAVKQNIMGMGIILVSVKLTVLLLKIEKTKSEELPNGRMDLAMEELNKKF
jgi:hypothetical protein